ncbi:MAG: DUF1846 domain-containing protein [Bacilli bacterium]|nr:DUF1846 domain-containing protein [Bacilli bacterium]
MNKQAFDNELYLRIQRENILKRIEKFDDKLYLEVGGKLFDDNHASRVLPGFAKDDKFQILLSLKDQLEIVIVVNSEDITKRKIRSDTGITYDVEVERLILTYKAYGFKIAGVVLSMYEDNPNTLVFSKHIKSFRVPIYHHYRINGYPEKISLIVSEQGLGKNEYIKTERPLIVVTAPGPGSGKLATCLSQLYHDNKKGIKSGYAKYETFPVWNLPLNHPVNIAYEAATVDLDDINMIDPYYLEATNIAAVNYNRDIEAFPLLKAIFEKIYGYSPYNSPTDMGVNMVGYAIKDDKAIQDAARQEIVRRYYESLKNNLLGTYSDDMVMKSQLLMQRVNIDLTSRPVIKKANTYSEKIQAPVLAIQLEDGTIVTGKRSELLSATSAALLNALKKMANIDDKIPLLSRGVIEPIQTLKVESLKNVNPKIRAEEILIALAIQAITNPLAELALSKLKDLEGLEAHSSSILAASDLKTLNKLGLRVTEEPCNFVTKIISDKKE